MVLAVGAPGLSDEAADAGRVDYARQVKPLLRERCYACHGGLKQEAGLRLDTGAEIRRGGSDGPVIGGAGKPGASRLIERVTALDASQRMPPEGEALTAAQIDLLRRWIAQGADSPDDELAEADPRDHWAFRVPRRAALPGAESRPASLAGNPIDAFVGRELAVRGMTARGQATKSEQLRRVYLDLVGVPPTREELHTFFADESPDAYLAVVDRLLNSPMYGERWGRHWMDVWRYADWYGRRHVPDVWNSAPQIWRWRDWIIHSLNEDKGYDRMVVEMLAADEICPEDPQAAVATGFLVRNWYALNPNDWMRNNVEHTGKAFLGLTFNCAHCHDHKYDPITHEDYFKFRAFFEPMYVRQDRLAGEGDPGPFQDYDYSVLRKIQRLGLVRVFDKSPDAPTWFYTGGDERNRVSERGSIPPGVPAFLERGLPPVTRVELPPRGWYPGLQPAIQETVLAETRRAILKAEADFTALRDSRDAALAAQENEKLAQAEAGYVAAVEAARQSGRSTTIAGKQSLVFDAAQGRRIVHNRLADLKQLPPGTVLEFQLALRSDAHFNFQLARDVDQGLTAGYVAFEKGRIVSYEPGTFTEFEVGRYDFAAGQARFHVQLELQSDSDACLLSVREANVEKPLIDRIPVARNGWNAAGERSQGITFDARTGSVAAVDEVVVKTRPAPGGTAGAPWQVAVHFDFEPPAYREGADAIGVGGWEASKFSTAPATSTVASYWNDAPLDALKQQLDAVRRAARLPDLRLQAAESQVAASRAELASIEARIAADRAKFGEATDTDPDARAREAARREFEAAVGKRESELLAQEVALAVAEAKPGSDANRAQEIEAAGKALNEARAAVEKAQAARPGDLSTTYSPFSPAYPPSSTGRRSALAAWITHPENPLTARVAVNHIWLRHFHAPLVATVDDFGRNGSAPTHPELLDWLAVELIESGWSMKHLHRLIVTSETYRRTSSSTGAANEITLDPENKLLWRMNTGRMEAEVLRDSLLACGGILDRRLGGQPLENPQALKTFRRSVYYEVFPEDGGASDLAMLFDAPNPLDCYRRTRSVVPQQALALTNSDLVHRISQQIVQDWEASIKAPPPAEPAGTLDHHPFVTAMFERILSRAPAGAEQQVCLEALTAQTGLFASTNQALPATAARESLVRALLNHNDFVTIR